MSETHVTTQVCTDRIENWSYSYDIAQADMRKLLCVILVIIPYPSILFPCVLLCCDRLMMFYRAVSFPNPEEKSLPDKDHLAAHHYSEQPPDPQDRGLLVMHH